MSTPRHQISACLLETDSESTSAPLQTKEVSNMALLLHSSQYPRDVGQPWLVSMTGLISGELLRQTIGLAIQIEVFFPREKKR